MSLKHRYTRTRPPEEEKRGPAEGFDREKTPPQKPKRPAESCTCWVLLRGDSDQTKDRHTTSCELVPDPSCPVHGKKRFPILEDEDWSD